MLGGERGGWCCRGSGRLEVHVTTRARLFGPRRATASGRLAVHTGALAAPNFPTKGVKVGEDQ